MIASTGADVAACLVGALGALSGPLHGGAPSRALDTLDAIGTPDRIDPWVRAAGAGRRPDHGLRPRRLPHRGPALADAARGRGVARAGAGAERLVTLAEQVERRVVEMLAELKPGRELHTNVEFYAGVVMALCGLPREMFTPTFAVARVDRLVGQRARAGPRQQDHPPVGPVRRPAAAPAGAAAAEDVGARTRAVRRAAGSFVGEEAWAVGGGPRWGWVTPLTPGGGPPGGSDVAQRAHGPDPQA